jgi:dolichol-phosphate mannosyltransferase
VKKVVIIPTYNEKENAAAIIAAVMQLEGAFHVLIVDDGSPDGTAQIVKDLAQQKYAGRLHIIERSGKLGLGTAYITGFKWAIQNGYDYIFEMDADFSHNPKDLIRLFDACHNGGADISVGSRYVKGGKLENWPADRIFISKGASFYTRLITWMPIKDTTAGFMCYKRHVLEALPLDEIRFIGYAFQIEMKYRSWKKGFKIKEVPITFTDRILGASKMSKGIIKEAVLGVWKMKWFIK